MKRWFFMLSECPFWKRCATSQPRSSNTPSQLRHKSILKTHVNVGVARVCVKTVDPEAEEAVWMRYNGFSLMQDQYFSYQRWMYLSLSIQRHIHLCRHAALACCRCSGSAAPPPPPLQARHAHTHTLKHQTPLMKKEIYYYILGGMSEWWPFRIWLSLPICRTLWSLWCLTAVAVTAHMSDYIHILRMWILSEKGDNY